MIAPARRSPDPIAASSPDLYRGLCASEYDRLLPADEIGDLEYYRAVIEKDGEPALEIGCGTGRLLLAFAESGLNVAGVDLSAEMLDICRAKATCRSLSVPLYRQPMERLDLGRQFATIYVPVGTFMLLPDRGLAVEALQRFRAHLDADGKLIVSLHLPWLHDVATAVARPNEWTQRREHVDSTTGIVRRCWELARYDFIRQQKHSQLRFEVVHDGRVVREESCTMVLRWYGQQEFRELLESVGFEQIHAHLDYSCAPATPDSSAFTIVARRAS